VLRVHRPDDTDEFVAVGGGFLVVQKERTTVLTRSAERPEEIDIERATRARERARERLAGNRLAIDAARAESALQRALARLKVAEYVTVRK
jgi:F-type H+-transporting ATPase subunit epsilon